MWQKLAEAAGMCRRKASALDFGFAHELHTHADCIMPLAMHQAARATQWSAL